jgi:hypothetical protein
VLQAFPNLKRLDYAGNPITFDGEQGTDNVMVQQELTAKFSAMAESKFHGIDGAPTTAA